MLGYGLFLLQFVRFGIDRIAYGILIAFLLIVLTVKIALTKTTWKSLWPTLRISWNRVRPKHSTKRYSISSVLLIVYIVLFLAAGFYFVTQFPSYADDAF